MDALGVRHEPVQRGRIDQKSVQCFLTERFGEDLGQQVVHLHAVRVGPNLSGQGAEDRDHGCPWVVTVARRERTGVRPGQAPSTGFSNLPENIDEAFRRRLLVHVPFPEPDVAMRRMLWKTLMPPYAPIGDDLDLDVLARSFELSGGFIRNAVVCAAYASRESGLITMSALHESAIEQTRAAGKLVRVAP